MLKASVSLSPFCPLCHGSLTRLILTQIIKEERRLYWQCPECWLVSLDPTCHLSRTEEKARYDTHRNGPEYEGYVQFLRRLTDPLVPQLASGAQGLDFGCGPGAALDMMMDKAGFPTVNYDPFYAPDKNVLAHQYDFVTCTEAAEHFYDPRETFLLLKRLLVPSGGILGVMTYTYDDATDFASWWYLKDPTHVSLYHIKTFQWLAQWLKLSLQIYTSNIFFLRNS